MNQPFIVKPFFHIVSHHLLLCCIHYSLHLNMQVKYTYYIVHSKCRKMPMHLQKKNRKLQSIARLKHIGRQRGMSTFFFRKKKKGSHHQQTVTLLLKPAGTAASAWAVKKNGNRFNPKCLQTSFKKRRPPCQL